MSLLEARRHSWMEPSCNTVSGKSLIHHTHTYCNTHDDMYFMWPVYIRSLCCLGCVWGVENNVGELKLNAYLRKELSWSVIGPVLVLFCNVLAVSVWSESRSVFTFWSEPNTPRGLVSPFRLFPCLMQFLVIFLLSSFAEHSCFTLICIIIISPVLCRS